MRSLGITATEAGPVGYLGSDAAEVSETLRAGGMQLVGAFLPVVLHDPGALEDTLAAARETAEMLAATGATKLVSAAVVDLGWSRRVALDEAAWRHVFDALQRIDDIAGAAGLEHVLHPHANTIVELDEDLVRVLEESDVRICLDTGHLVIGGTNVVALAESHADRVGHVHLKDVRLPVAERFRRREIDLVQATRQGLFCALGDGDVLVADTIGALETRGYAGWYVLEQDTTLEPADVDGTRPLEDAAKSIAFVGRCLAGREGGDAIA